MTPSGSDLQSPVSICANEDELVITFDKAFWQDGGAPDPDPPIERRIRALLAGVRLACYVIANRQRPGS